MKGSIKMAVPVSQTQPRSPTAVESRGDPLEKSPKHLGSTPYRMVFVGSDIAECPEAMVMVSARMSAISAITSGSTPMMVPVLEDWLLIK